jgi:hypothetical protein
MYRIRSGAWQSWGSNITFEDEAAARPDCGANRRTGLDNNLRFASRRYTDVRRSRRSLAGQRQPGGKIGRAADERQVTVSLPLPKLGSSDPFDD